MLRRGGTLVRRIGSQYRLLLTVGTADAGRTLLEAARESGAQVREFYPASRSLEDIFLEAVE